MAEEKFTETVTEEVTTTEEKACKKNGKKVIIAVIALCAVALLCVGGFFAYRMLKNNNPVKVTSDAIRGLKDNIKDVKDENPGLTKLLEGDDPVEVNTDIKVTLPQGLGKYTANILAQLDGKKEMYNFDVTAKSGKDLIFTLSAAVNGTDFFFKFPDTMTNYYSMNLGESLNELKASMDEIDTKAVEKAMKYDWTKLIDYVADAIDKTFSKDDFKKTSDEITVDGKDIKVNKYTAKVTAKDAAKIAENVLNSVLKDKELIDVLATLTDSDKDEVKDGLKDMIEEIKDADFNTDEYINYSVYVSKTGKVIGCGFEYKGVEITFATRGDVTEIKVSASGITATIAIEEKDDNHYVITASTMGVSAELDIKDEVKTVKKNEEYKENLTISFKLSYIGMDEDITAKLEVESVTKKISSVKKITDAKDIEKLSNAEQEKLLKEVEKSVSYKTIESLMKLFESNSLYETKTSNYSY